MGAAIKIQQTPQSNRWRTGEIEAIPRPPSLRNDIRTYRAPLFVLTATIVVTVALLNWAPANIAQAVRYLLTIF